MIGHPIRRPAPEPGGCRRLGRREFLRAAAVSLAATGLACRATGERPEASAGGLSLYTWAEYQSPENLRRFGDRFGFDVAVDVFESDEALMAKLALTGGGAGYDLIVPSLPYVGQLIARNLLQPLDYGLIPNAVNQDPAIVARRNEQGGDANGTYTVVKNWGATGFVYDTTVVQERLHDWRDFFRAAARPGVSGRVSVLASPADVAGLVFWRDGIDWRTTASDHLDHAERTLVTEIAPYVAAFDSYPAMGLLSGSYVLSQAWNGDARRAIIEAPDRLQWVTGAPAAELFIDTWAILRTAPHPEIAHAWIDYLLQPEASAREIAYIGYDTGVRGAEAHLPQDLPERSLIFLSEEERARLVPGEVNGAQDRLVAIYNRVRAAAALQG